MTHFIKRYYPTVCIRRAEMKAMEMLPAAEKAKMLPIVLLAPWLNSIEFDNTFKIISKSIGDIPVIVDLDRYFFSSSALPSRNYFRKLIDPVDGPIHWMDLVKAHENYIPSIQLPDITDDLIRWQVEQAINLGRGFAVRVELARALDSTKIYNLIEEIKDEDFTVIIDYGYVTDPLQAEAKIASWIDHLLAISKNVNFVICGSSFPNSFSDYDDFSGAKTIDARLIYNNLSRRYGNSNFFYGDWASTKPRRYDGGGSKPLPRIDFPTQDKWIISRSKEGQWDFQKAAEMITRLPEWDNRPMVWGTGMIEKAAKAVPGGISTGPQSIAARVNIHLFLQNNFGGLVNNVAPQGKWIDPI